jgi:hypothetical protein
VDLVVILTAVQSVAVVLVAAVQIIIFQAVLQRRQGKAIAAVQVLLMHLAAQLHLAVVAVQAQLVQAEAAIRLVQVVSAFLVILIGQLQQVQDQADATQVAAVVLLTQRLTAQVVLEAAEQAVAVQQLLESMAQ